PANSSLVANFAPHWQATGIGMRAFRQRITGDEKDTTFDSRWRWEKSQQVGGRLVWVVVVYLIISC
ncbi:MAG TPA: hypothetical protein VL096_02370, partial [Pirellulaceae bacterium]|nr:hypothetical protein [Pirellulaceae bacterium]